MNDPEVTRYLMAGRVPQTVESITAFVQSLPPWAYAIEYQERHVGNIMLRALDEASCVGEVGVLLGDRSVWGKGVASAALNQLTRIAFDELKLKKLWAGTCNPACSRLFQRNWWAREGTQREHVFLNGIWHDHELFGRWR